MNTRVILSFALPCLLAISLSACQGKDVGDNSKTAAKVNGDSIGVGQVETTLATLGELDGERRQKTANEILKRMVDQQLLAQEATAAKLDQDPKVEDKLEVARRQILAESQVEQLTRDVAKPGENEISDHYRKHPELFAQRRIFRLQEVVIGSTAENIAAIREELAGAKTLNEFAQWAQQQGIPVQARQAVKPAEALPAELLAKLQPLKDGGFITAVSGDKLSLIVLSGAENRPVSQEDAKPAIERYLTNAKRREIVAAALKQLHEKAKIEYLPPYQAISTAPAAASDGGQ